MMSNREIIAQFGLVLTAVRHMAEEQKWPKEKTLETLEEMLGPRKRNAAVNQAIERLKLAEDSLSLLIMLGQEEVRAWSL